MQWSAWGVITPGMTILNRATASSSRSADARPIDPNAVSDRRSVTPDAVDATDRSAYCQPAVTASGDRHRRQPPSLDATPTPSRWEGELCTRLCALDSSLFGSQAQDCGDGFECSRGLARCSRVVTGRSNSGHHRANVLLAPGRVQEPRATETTNWSCQPATRSVILQQPADGKSIPTTWNPADP